MLYDLALGKIEMPWKSKDYLLSDFFEYSLASSSTIASISFSDMYCEFNIAFLIIIVIIGSGERIHIIPFIPIATS